jgi:predicted CxxxxCH...CXXCH cytochrome family protein
MRMHWTQPLMSALLLLAACSRIDDTAKPAESCDLCHTAPLSRDAVHRMHLSARAMADFPFADTSAAAKMGVVESATDSTFRIKADPNFKFVSNPAQNQVLLDKQTRLLGYGIQCSDCHKGIDAGFARNDDPNHRNGKKDASFDTDALLAKHYNASDTAHYLASAPGMSFDGTGCDNVLCHGAGRKPLKKVAWQTKAALTDTLSCLACHDTRNHNPGASCEKCHLDVTLDGGKTIHNFRKHLNDTISYGIQKF